MKYEPIYLRSYTPNTLQNWPDVYVDAFNRIIMQTDFPNNIGVLANKRACMYDILHKCQIQANNIFFGSATTWLNTLPAVEGLMFERNNIASGLYIRCMNNPMYAYFRLSPIYKATSDLFYDLTLNDVVF